MPFLKRAPKKVYHIDHLPLNNRKVIKTLFESNVPDLMRLYGLDYVIPLWGEPIFIPYGYFTEEYKDSSKLLRYILELKDEVVREGLENYKQWYPNRLFIDFYRIVQYSYVNPYEGMELGLAFHPLSASPSGFFKLEEIKKFIINKKVLIANQTLFGKTLSESILKNAKDIMINDIVRNKISEIIEFHLWLIKYIHENYDKEKLYDLGVAKEYMNIGVNQLLTLLENRNIEVNNILSGYDIVLLPIFVINKEFQTNSNDIINAWVQEPSLKEVLRQGRFHEINSLPIVMSYKVIEELILQIFSKYDTIILLFDKKVPKIEKCKYECPQIIKNYKIIEEGDQYKIIQFK
jgi:hypothetical protein